MNIYANILNRIINEGDVSSGKKGSFIQVNGFYGGTWHHTTWLRHILDSQYLDLDKIMNEITWQMSGNEDIRPMLAKGILSWSKPLYKFYGNNKLSYKEWLDYKSNPNQHEYIALNTYNRIFRDYWNDFLQKFLNKPHSRNNIFSFLDNKFSEKNSVQQPCISAFQLLPVNDYTKQFDLVVTWRSCDATLGLAWDTLQMIYIATLLCKSVGYTLRNVTTFFNNIHIYMNNLAAAKQLIAKENVSILREAKLDYTTGTLKIVADYYDNVDEKKFKTNVNV